MAWSVPLYGPMAAAAETSDGARRQRAHLVSDWLASRQDGSASPQVSQHGGENETIEDQHCWQTGPSVGDASGSRQATHTGAMRSASAASDSARVLTTARAITTQLRNYATPQGLQVGPRENEPLAR
jgi:hypothetical protein